MHVSMRVTRPARTRPPTARAAVAIIVTAGLALPAAALAGRASAAVAGGSPHARASALSQSANTQKALAYARCMRSHGVPNWPDPIAHSNGVLPKRSPQQIGVSSSALHAAETGCGHLLPNGGGPTPAALQQSWTDFLKFAQCMRRHGVTNWPDPTRYPQHPDRPYFDLPAGIDPNSPQLSPEIHTCPPLLHGNNPQHFGEGGS
jgi:hypothetical protein